MTPSAPPPAGRTRSGSSSTRPAPATSRRSGSKEIVAALPAGIVKVGVFVNREAGGGGTDGRGLRPRPDPAPRRRIAGVLPPVSAGADHQGRLPPDAGGSPALDAYDVRAFLVDFRERAATAGRGSGPTGGSPPGSRRSRPLILAGGLGHRKHRRGARGRRPRGRGHQQRLERTPGVKDHERMRRIIAIGSDGRALPDRESSSTDRKRIPHG